MRPALRVVLFAILAILVLPAAGWAEALARPGAPVYAYAFNVGSQDVTVIDTGTNEVVETLPLGAGVRWLSNEQDFWDGRHIWTYDLVDGQAHLIAIEPAKMEVVRRKEIGNGPAHSVQLTPDRGHLLVNAAGDNLLAVVERRTLEIVRRVQTGLFPCDIDLSPDGSVAYFPERDQHTVAALDLATGEITKRVAFMEGSKPHMLRVSPDGATIWVQTAAAGSNAVLDADTLAIRTHGKLGQAPGPGAPSRAPRRRCRSVAGRRRRCPHAPAGCRDSRRDGRVPAPRA